MKQHVENAAPICSIIAMRSIEIIPGRTSGVE